ncbi:RNA polymerase sigma factor [Aestuariibaculum suncheonense]|uniref:RNA polymerase sigma-70 factor n=1 Tax=Aestuariibaculum suncheonense TaxID=1028745 RepID=A0A8J6UHX3_9FLAO|nr:RNA polymerase sigma-70 factor [Aestuariibaculum suncheonense]MBD0836069.1 RNA polymerase sigma-70 factor [Aestuariibaculum suncheonense]
MKIVKTSDNDQGVLNRIANNDSDAFKEIHDKYSREMFVYAFNILRNKEVCEDIIQNIFIDLWSKRQDVEINNLESYLFRAVKYQIFNYFRSNKIKNEDVTRLNLIDSSINAAKKMEFHEFETAIKNSINKLPKRCREIFELSRLEHKSNKEIAEELGISIQGVKNQISKALNFIREDLRREELILCFSLFY